MDKEDNISEYRKAELTTLRSEISLLLGELHKWENFALIAIGTIYGGFFLKLFNTDHTIYYKFIYALAPIFISFIGYVRSAQISNFIRLKDSYLASLENSVFNDGDRVRILNCLEKWKEDRNSIRKRFSGLLFATNITKKYLGRLVNETDNRCPDEVRGWVHYFYEMGQESYILREVFWSVTISITLIMALVIIISP